MLLKDYLKKLSSEAAVNDPLNDFAVRCNTTVGQLKNVSSGSRRAGESLAINIERESRGAVRCEDLRPDVDWNYLRGTKADKAA